MRDAIFDYLRDHEHELLEDILRLVSVRSVTDDRVESRRALAVFLELAAGYGLEARSVAGGDVGIVEFGPRLPPGAETLGILAHVDVVDPGDLSSWSRNPWGEIAAGSVWGRGTQDDKGPLLMCLHAVRAMVACGHPVRKRIRFVVGTMEEADWADIRRWLTEPDARPPDYGFTPDGEFPVINREKGYCDAWLSFPAESASTVGPFRLESLESGTSINSVPDSARATISGLGVRPVAIAALASASSALRESVSIALGPDDRAVLLARGRAAHSSRPDLGSNALVALCRAISLLGRNTIAAFVTERIVGDYLTSGLEIRNGREEVVGECIGPATISPDIARTDESSFHIGINIRTSFGQGLDDIAAAFCCEASRYAFSFRLEQFMPAILVRRDQPFMQDLAAAYEARTGERGEFLLAPGSSYAKALPNHVAFGPILPTMTDLCHQADERLSLEEIRSITAIYAEAIASISAGEPLRQRS
ncbi:MAG: hypothetical protein CVV47_08925 [Spirochaetae bacterium HGW-Spirochaetae-3]|jgi:succinyl-diaminopimelate desuccinylase|nr:MAG: hypothetical protein CVV47_08925 [Spirochaetae bacterium HGW-Spirochaetae-3]